MLASLLPPSLRLIRHSVKRAKGRFGVPAVLVLVAVRFALHMVVGLVEKPDKSVDLVPGFLAEAAYGLKGLFRGDRGFVVDRGC